MWEDPQCEALATESLTLIMYPGTSSSLTAFGGPIHAPRPHTDKGFVPENEYSIPYQPADEMSTVLGGEDG